ncbi:MAG TPA: DUF6788 family protein [Candidatus Bathyarchaeia archaeon]|nr:DUF6788 family protein [Candidatus Bathyarchaeia archaeon]
MQTSQVVLRKQHEKTVILEALELKQRLKGSVVWERVNCGKHCCHKCQNGTLHGPYTYLHYYSAGKVKRKYLPKALGELMFHSREELEVMLRDVDAEILGQEEGDEY